jgi:streptogramin lyase
MTTAVDKPAITYQMARTWAAAKQWPETIDWLQRVVDFKIGLDPSRDSIFAALRGAREFDALLATVHASTPPISYSSVAFRIAEADLVPESMAFDPASEHFYFGSITKGKVLECASIGSCRQFASGLGTVLGAKVNGSSLWLLNNQEHASDLMRYDLGSGRLLHKFSLSESGHHFNDLAFGPRGEVYVTDTRAAAVWRLAPNSSRLTRLSHRFEFANGISISPDGRLLYISTFPDGITILDLKTGQATPISRPADLCLVSIDGLYFHRDSLIAIQNGFMNPIQDGKKSGFVPISVLKIRL